MTTIEQVRIVEAGKISLDRVELAPCGPRDAIVDVAACGICGSDLSYIRLGGLAGPSGEPMALGHELAGTVTTVGAEVTDIAVVSGWWSIPARTTSAESAMAPPKAGSPMQFWSGRRPAADGYSRSPMT